MPVDRFLHPRLGHSVKVAGLSDLTYRVWTQYLLSADDFGVMRASPLVLQAANDALAKRPAAILAKCLRTLVDVGLVLEFEHQGFRFIYQWDWQTFQKIRFPRQSENPRPPPVLSNNLGDSADYGEGSVIRQKKNGEISEELQRNLPARARGKRLTANGIRHTAYGKRLTANGNGNGLYSIEFLQFWTTYPRKIGKDAAWKAWVRRDLPGDLLDTILAAIESQQQSDQWQQAGGRYIPHPSTWLNRGSWADEVTPPPLVSDQSRANLAAIEGAKALLKARRG